MRQGKKAVRATAGSVGIGSHAAAVVVVAASLTAGKTLNAGTTSNWLNGNGGDWSTTSNWSAGVPNGEGNEADFLSGRLTPAPSGDVYINIDQENMTVGTLRFDDLGSGSSWYLDGLDLTLSAGSGTAPSIVVDGAGARAVVGGTTFSARLATTSGLTKAGTGTLSIQTYSVISGGAVSVQKGALELAANNALGNSRIDLDISASAFVHRVASTSNTVTNLDVRGTVDGDGTLNVYGNVSGGNGGTISSTSSNAGFLALTKDATHDFAVDQGMLTVSSRITASSISGTNAPNVTKSGAGTLTLNAANSYTGTTAVNAGTLVLNGSLSGSATTGAVTVASGARLEGTGNGSSTGKAGGSVTVSGTIAPSTTGGTAGKLTTGAETWAAGGRYEADIVGATSGSSLATPTATATDADQLIMSAMLTSYSSAFTVVAIPNAGTMTNFAPSTSSPIYDWVIGRLSSGTFTNGQTLNLGLDVSAFGTLNGGVGMEKWHFSLLALNDSSSLGGTAGAGKQDVVLHYDYNAVPEATTLLLGMAGLTPMLLQRRTRRASAGSAGKAVGMAA